MPQSKLSAGKYQPSDCKCFVLQLTSSALQISRTEGNVFLDPILNRSDIPLANWMGETIFWCGGHYMAVMYKFYIQIMPSSLVSDWVLEQWQTTCKSGCWFMAVLTFGHILCWLYSGFVQNISTSCSTVLCQVQCQILFLEHLIS